MPFGLPVLPVFLHHACIGDTPYTIDLFDRWSRLVIMQVCHELGAMDDRRVVT